MSYWPFRAICYCNCASFLLEAYSQFNEQLWIPRRWQSSVCCNPWKWYWKNYSPHVWSWYWHCLRRNQVDLRNSFNAVLSGWKVPVTWLKVWDSVRVGHWRSSALEHIVGAWFSQTSARLLVQLPHLLARLRNLWNGVIDYHISITWIGFQLSGKWWWFPQRTFLRLIQFQQEDERCFRS